MIIKSNSFPLQCHSMSLINLSKRHNRSNHPTNPSINSLSHQWIGKIPRCSSNGRRCLRKMTSNGVSPITFIEERIRVMWRRATNSIIQGPRTKTNRQENETSVKESQRGFDTRRNKALDLRIREQLGINERPTGENTDCETHLCFDDSESFRDENEENTENHEDSLFKSLRNTLSLNLRQRSGNEFLGDYARCEGIPIPRNGLPRNPK